MRLIRYEQPDWSSLWPENLLNRWFGESGRQGLAELLGETVSAATGSRAGRSGALHANLYQDDDHYYARFELPGVKREDVGVELHKAVLTVSYTSRPTGGGEGDEAATESTHSVSRSISLPEDVRADGVQARLEDGVLTITLPKQEESKPRSIQIL